MSEAGDVPVLMMVFNRPDKTREVFERVREQRPSRLFVAADGPRASRPDDDERCVQVREIFANIDWPCRVERRYQDENLGCKRGVETAINWFFSQVDHGIILEDDCVPSRSFFPFCAELLERYRHHPDVVMISGNNRMEHWPTAESYTFTRFFAIWGWATWQRAWQHYDPDLTHWKAGTAQDVIRLAVGDDEVYADLAQHLDEVASGRLDTWDYVWTYSALLAEGLAAVPAKNLVANVGFGPDATHTFNEWSRHVTMPAHELSFPLRHPRRVRNDAAYARAVHDAGDSFRRRVVRALPVGLRDPLRRTAFTLKRLVGSRPSRSTVR